MHEGNENDEIWIGVKHSYDEDIYWQDGSYQNVSSTQATHVSYSGEHSAIRLGNGLYRSKWGAWPLVEHDSVQRLTKAVYAYKDFYGQYTSDNLTGIIDYSHVFYVKPGVNTAITNYMPCHATLIISTLHTKAITSTLH